MQSEYKDSFSNYSLRFEGNRVQGEDINVNEYIDAHLHNHEFNGDIKNLFTNIFRIYTIG